MPILNKKGKDSYKWGPFRFTWRRATGKSEHPAWQATCPYHGDLDVARGFENSLHSHQKGGRVSPRFRCLLGNACYFDGVAGQALVRGLQSATPEAAGGEEDHQAQRSSIQQHRRSCKCAVFSAAQSARKHTTARAQARHT